MKISLRTVLNDRVAHQSLPEAAMKLLVRVIFFHEVSH
jgi:hypothetical protein